MATSSEVITISGKRGFGKTTIAETLIRSLSRVAIWDAMDEYNHPCSYVPKEHSMKEFDNFLRVQWERGNVFVFVDEADQVMPEGKPLTPYANKIINLGRHRNIGMGAITRRLARLNKTTFSQSREVYLFHHFIPNDLKYLADFIGKKEAERVRLLKKYQYLRYSF